MFIFAKNGKMGLEIKRTKKGKYKLKSTISNERLHDDVWISENEAKKILIDREFIRFMENVAKIGMDFPAHYYVNGRLEDYPKDKQSFGRWWLDNDCKSEPLYKKVEEIVDDLDIEYLKNIFENEETFSEKKETPSEVERVKIQKIIKTNSGLKPLRDIAQLISDEFYYNFDEVYSIFRREVGFGSDIMVKKILKLKKI